MKKFLVILSALVCVLGLSMPSFAYSTIPASSCNYLTYNEEGDFYALNTELKVSSMSEQQLEYWKLFTDAFTGQSNDEYVVYFDPDYNNLCFLALSSGSYFRDDSYASLIVPSGGYWCCLSFKVSSGQYLSPADFFAGSYGAQFYSKYVLIKTSFSPISSKVGSVVDLNEKNLQITDDIGSLKPEEPDPPSSSSTPAWIPPVVSDPVIPAGDEYVFYDTKILGLFLNHVRTQIVHAANVGWLIFGFILVWHVIKRVIKAFSSR